MTAPYSTLAEAAVAVLSESDPAEKCRIGRDVAEAWRSGAIGAVGNTTPPDRPARPAQPELLAPRDMPRRSSGPKGRIALLHALAHIELNAIDLAWDIITRFTHEDLPKGFYDDWVSVAAEEAEHFELLQGLLAALGAAYGDFPAHDGLWQAAEKTAHDLRARLAVVPLIHEARGLDTTPPTLARLRAQGETAEVIAVLETIYADEIKHVAAGTRWFRWIAERDGRDPADLFAEQIALNYKGGLKPPFNDEGRGQAGFPREWYVPLVRIEEKQADAAGRL